MLSIAVNSDLELAIELATAPWIVDGVNFIEADSGLHALYVFSQYKGIQHASPALARQMMRYIPYPPTKSDFFLVGGLRTLAVKGPDGFERLMQARWFRDGLDEEERIYLIAATESSLNADQLVAPYKVESATVILPHSGAVNVWFVHRRSAHAGRRVLVTIEKAVRDIEQFWELPFHVDNLIFSVLGDLGGILGVYRGHVVLLDPNFDESGRNGPRVIYHEMAHYFFNFGPAWFFEGGADYVEGYFLTSHGGIPRAQFRNVCRRNGVNNLQELIELGVDDPLRSCRYEMGMHFMVALRKAMGEKPWLSVLRALYLEYGYARLFYQSDPIDDETVYRAIMEHTPPSLRNRVRDVFRRLHGGPFVD